MTEPSQYFKGRTVQEQMDEVIGYVDVRSAEVATTAIASDVAQVHQDMLDADADAQAAAASAAAAAGTLANAVKKTGEASQSIAGDIAVAGTLSGGVVTGTQVTVPTPVNNTDAANKKYVDDYHDATKLNITDVNNYAVGMTSNQGPILGVKNFEFSPKCQYGGSQGTGNGWFKLWESETSVMNVRRTTVLSIIFRESGAFAKLVLVRRLGNQTTTTKLYGNTPTDSIIVTRDSDGKMTVWTNTTRTSGWIECETAGTGVAEVSTSTVLSDNTLYTEPQAADYSYLVKI